MQLISGHKSSWRRPTVQDSFCSLVGGLWEKAFRHPFAGALFEWTHGLPQGAEVLLCSLHRWLPASLHRLGLQIHCCPEWWVLKHECQCQQNVLLLLLLMMLMPMVNSCRSLRTSSPWMSCIFKKKKIREKIIVFMQFIKF